MIFLFPTLVLVACFLLYQYVRKQYNYFKDLGILHLPPTLVLGNMADPVLRRRHVSQVALDVYNLNHEAKYVGAYDFMQPIIVIRDPELIKSILITNFDSFTHHRSFATEDLDPIFGQNLFNLNGDKWRRARALLSPAFTSSKLKLMFELIAECSENLIKLLAEVSKDPNNVIDIKDILSRYTNDAIATCSFGISIDSINDRTNEFYLLGRKALDLEGPIAFKFFFSRACPRLMKLLGIKFVSEKTEKFFENIIRNTIETRIKEGTTRPDMIQLMINLKEKGEDMEVSEMVAHAFSFYFAGFDTTASKMCSIAQDLAMNPHVQRKLQAEIDEIERKCGGKPTYDALSNMPYFDAVFFESLRLHADVTFLDRICTKPFELPPPLPGGKPFTLQPGMSIWVSVTGLHFDPQIHADPEKYDPERYSSTKATSSVSNLGFGLGPRICVGQRFAILTTKIMFYYLLSKYNLKTNHKTCIPYELSAKTFSHRPKGGFWLTIEPRSDKM